MSWFEADGDYVVAHKQSTAKNGDIVIEDRANAHRNGSGFRQVGIHSPVVQLADGRSAVAKVVGRDSKTDIVWQHTDGSVSVPNVVPIAELLTAGVIEAP